MRKAMTAAVALVWLLAAAVPVLGADPQQVGGTDPAATATTTDQAKPAADPATAAKAPADQAKPADAAKPAEPKAQTPAAAKPNPNALTKNTYGGGFRLGSDDGRFMIRIFAATQFRYTYMVYDNEVNGNSEDYSNFYMRRARLWFDGNAYSPKFTYAFQIQLEPQSAVNLHDAWVQYALDPMFQVGVGRNKIGYGLEFVNSGFGNNFVDRSIFSGETDISNGGGFSKWPGGGVENFATSGEDANTGYPVGGLNLFRSQGLQISGKTTAKGPVFEYQTGIWQGRNTKGSSNPATGHLVAGRAGFYPNGWINWLFAGDVDNTQTFKTGVLVSAYHDARKRKVNAGGTAVPTYDTTDRGFDAAFMARYRGFSADIEWATETFELSDATLVGENQFDRGGWRAQFGYFLKPKKVEVVGRYAEVERLKDATPISARNSGLGLAKVKNASGAFQDALEGKMTEMTVGLNWYLSNSAHQHVIFVDYSRLGREFGGFVSGNSILGGVPDQKDDRVRAMLQLKF